MKTLFIKVAVFTLILGVAGLAAGEPRIQGEAVEYSTQGVVMKSRHSGGNSVRVDSDRLFTTSSSLTLTSAGYILLYECDQSM